jgi:hypothetical protein
MATKDKAERLKTSTNKKVVAKTTSSVGTSYKTASGSKRIKHGDGNKPANTRAAYTTMGMETSKALKTGVVTPEDMNKIKRVVKTRRKMSTI